MARESKLITQARQELKEVRTLSFLARQEIEKGNMNAAEEYLIDADCHYADLFAKLKSPNRQLSNTEVKSLGVICASAFESYELAQEIAGNEIE